MSISFSEVPNTRVPWVYLEFNNSKAVAGSQTMPHKIAVIGQKLAAGTAGANTPISATSYAQAKTLFGAGSQLAFMADAIFKNNKRADVDFFPLAEVGNGTKATGKLSVSVSTAESGTIALMIAGKRIAVPVSAGQTAAQIATAIVAAITAKASDLPVTAVVNGTNNYEVDITCNWKGTTGNKIDIRHSYYQGEALPGGVTVTITDMASGATDPDVQDALDLFLETHYTEVISAYTDSANLTAFVAAMAARDVATVQLDGYVFAAADDTHGNLTTLGNLKNSKHLLIMGYKNSPTPPWEWAAALGTKCSFEASLDPAKPVQTVELVGILPPAQADRFTAEERDLLLFDGISTFTVDANGSVRIERVITTYKTNPAGADDVSYLNWETVATLSYLRYDFRNIFLRKYPRFKLADDGNRFSEGQEIMTPKTAKAEAVSIFNGWQELGLVENADAFKEALVIERNALDKDRLDFEMEPDLVNQLRVVAGKISFIL